MCPQDTSPAGHAPQSGKRRKEGEAEERAEKEKKRRDEQYNFAMNALFIIFDFHSLLYVLPLSILHQIVERR